MKRIRFQGAKFRNFLSYGNTWQEFYFANGLHIIQGVIVESEKSNGSGKTSLTELIPFALFGKTIKKVTKGNIVNWFNQKNCEVRLNFTVDDVPYEIRRGIKPNKLEVYCNGDQLPKLASAVDFQNQIEEEIIGMDFQTFQNLIYFSPNNTISIINASKPEKRKFLESLFDLSVYSKLLELTNAKIKANTDKCLVWRLEKDSLIRNNESLQEEVDNMVIPNLRKNKTLITALTMQLEELEKVEFDIDEGSIERQAKELLKMKDSLRALEKAYEHSKAQIELHQKIVEKIPDLEEIKKKRESILNEISIFDHSKFTDLEEDDLADDLQKKELMKEEIQELVKEIQELDKKKAVLESCIVSDDDNINVAKIRKRASVGVCDSCGQEVTKEILQKIVEKQVEEYEGHKREHQNSLDSVVESLQDLRKRKDELYEKVKVESERLSSIQEDIRIKWSAQETLKRLQERLADINDVEEEEEALVEGQRLIKFHQDANLERIGTIHMTELDIESAQSKLDELTDLKYKQIQHLDKLLNKRKELETEVNHFKELEKIADKAMEDFNKKKETIANNEVEIEELTEKIRKSDTLHDYLSYVRVSLKDENVKRFAISSLIPFLNQQTNMYLSESGFPYIATLDSWLDVTIRGLGVQEVSYGSLSGGETKCIDTAVQLACNDIASMMAKTSLDIMVLDEVLDSSVDKLGVQALLNIIRVRQRRNNDSVYVITHRNEIDEFTFDSIVRIISEDKFSRVEVE